MEEVEFTQRVFLALAIKNHERLQTGAKRRLQIKARLENGEDVDNYRTRWLHDSAMELIDLMRQQAVIFNSQHDDDQASSLDMMDILKTAGAILT